MDYLIPEGWSPTKIQTYHKECPDLEFKPETVKQNAGPHNPIFILSVEKSCFCQKYKNSHFEKGKLMSKIKDNCTYFSYLDNYWKSFLLEFRRKETS